MLEDILNRFGIKGNLDMFGDGHINTTYNIDGKYIIQKINTDVFTNPVGVMDNCFLVTEHIRRKLTEAGENPDRARNQFKLVKDMLSKKDEAEAIVEKYL